LTAFAKTLAAQLRLAIALPEISLANSSRRNWVFTCDKQRASTRESSNVRESASRTKRKKVLAAGMTGQSGAYPAELLKSKSYEIFGIVRRSSSFNTSRLSMTFTRIGTRKRSACGRCSAIGRCLFVNHVRKTVRPRKVYNLGAQSHVKVSFDIPDYTCDVTGLYSLAGILARVGE